MPNYKLVDSEKLDSDLTVVADAIRAKGGTAEALAFPDGMKTAIENIKAGGGGAELNIAYGDTPPEDTTKLWVKTSEPSKVKVKQGMSIVTSNERFETLETTLPSAIMLPSVATVGDKIYIFGGWGSAPTNTILCWDTATNTMRTIETVLPKAKYRMGIAVVGTLIYLFGGADSGSSSSTKEIYVFDTKTETIATHGTTLYSSDYTNEGLPTAVTMGTTVWLINRSSNEGFGIFDTISGQMVSTEINVGYYAHYGSAAQAVGNNIYVFGGFQSLGQTASKNIIMKIDAEKQSYNLLNITLPTAKNGMASVVFGSKIFLFGGTTTKSSSGADTTVLCFDTMTETILTMPITLPQKKIGVHTATVLGDNAYIFAGATSTDITKFVPNLKVFLENNNLQILPTYSSNKFNLINTDTAQVEIGVNKVYKGNADGVAEEVEAALYKDNSWVTI